MWDLIVSVPDHCLSFYFSKLESSEFFKHCGFLMFKYNMRLKLSIRTNIGLLG